MSARWSPYPVSPKNNKVLGLQRLRTNPASRDQGTRGPVRWKVSLSPPSPTMNILPNNVGNMRSDMNNILYTIYMSHLAIKPNAITTLALIHDMLQQASNIMEMSKTTGTSGGGLGHNKENRVIILMNDPPMQPISLKSFEHS